MPIFSVDYRLSPKYSFPAALNDVWQVYYWLIENAESKLGIIPRKVILVGDSAGGNLAAAITNMAIMRGYKVPDGILLAYPGKDHLSFAYLPYSSEPIKEELYSLFAISLRRSNIALSLFKNVFGIICWDSC